MANRVEAPISALTQDLFLKMALVTLVIESQEGQRTTVTLYLPMVEAPNWACSKIVIPADSQVCILDDDLSIHAAWNERLRTSIGSAVSSKIKHFFDPKHLVKYFESGSAPKENVILLSDYSLGEEGMNGLSVIRDLKLENISILVTGHSFERQVQESCEQMGVPLLP